MRVSMVLLFAWLSCCVAWAQAELSLYRTDRNLCPNGGFEQASAVEQHEQPDRLIEIGGLEPAHFDEDGLLVAGGHLEEVQRVERELPDDSIQERLGGLHRSPV